MNKGWKVIVGDLYTVIEDSEGMSYTVANATATREFIKRITGGNYGNQVISERR